nr:hypothetical protein [Tanacetum cinerariifolium]
LRSARRGPRARHAQQSHYCMAAGRGARRAGGQQLAGLHAARQNVSGPGAGDSGIPPGV